MMEKLQTAVKSKNAFLTAGSVSTSKLEPVANTEKMQKTSFLTAKPVSAGEQRKSSRSPSKKEPTQTSGRLYVKASAVELIKALKVKDISLALVSGAHTCQSKPLTESGPLRLQCASDEMMTIDVKDSQTEVINIKMSSETPKELVAIGQIKLAGLKM